MKRLLVITIGIIAVLVGMGFVMPAVAQWRQEGSMTGLSVALLLLGVALTLGGAGAAGAAMRRRTRRRTGVPPVFISI